MIQIKIKNFGPIPEANIRVGGLTIFAGTNNTGKSFASRLIYSVINSLQSDLYIERADEILNSLHSSHLLFDLDYFARIIQRRSGKATEIFKSIHEIISQLSLKAQTLEPKEISSQEFITQLKETRLTIENYLVALQSDNSIPAIDRTVRFLESYLHMLAEAQQAVSRKDIHNNFIRTQLRSNIERELIGNFRVPSVTTLMGPKKSTPNVNFVGDNNDISFNLERSDMGSRIKLNNVNISQYYPSNIFLESPIYWKIGVSGSRRQSSRSFLYENNLDVRQTVPELPTYVSSLRKNLLTEYTGEIAFPEVLEWINKKNAFKGKLILTTGGQLLYHDGRREYPLQTTATGITNIGIIGLLIERKLINERTVLFIDEPEANLHPAWQVLMAELLLKLAQAGISVVLATHSVDILKCIEVSAKTNEKIIDLVNLNHFPHFNDGDMEFFDRIRKIKNELTDPYYRMFIGDI